MNWTDYVLIAIVAASLIIGVARGLLREVITLLTWVAAVVLAWNYAYVLEPHLGGALGAETVRPWAARVLIFVVVVLIGSLLGALITHFVRLSLFSATDRFLGALFGLLRGVVIVGAFVMFCHSMRLQNEIWYRDSLLMPYAESAANVLRVMVGERKIHMEHSGTAS